MSANRRCPASPSRRELAFGLAASAVVLPRGARARDADAPPRRLTARPAAWALRPAPAEPTPIWCYDGALPVPVIQASAGDTISLDLTNGLPAPTSLHIAGPRLPNALDGIAGLTGTGVASEAEASLRVPAKDAGFFTFGPADPATASEQCGRGLGGVLVVADPKDPEVEADVVLTLRDWRLDPAGAIEASFAEASSRAGAGWLGNVFTIGGLGEARRLALAPGSRLRVRIANLSNARIVPLKIVDMHPTLIGVSGQQSAVFTPLHGELLLVPGGRFDLVCDIPTEARPPLEPQIRVAIGEGFPILSVAIADEPPRPAPKEPGWLSDNGLPAIVDLRRATRVDCQVTRAVDAKDAGALAKADPARLWAINGRSGDFAGPPLFAVKRGTPVVLAATNKSDMPVVLKLNGHVARLLHPRDDGWVPYWVDVVLVAPNTTERLAFIADNPGRWLLGGRILEHLAGGQFGWFEVR